MGYAKCSVIAKDIATSNVLRSGSQNFVQSEETLFGLIKLCTLQDNELAIKERMIGGSSLLMRFIFYFYYPLFLVKPDYVVCISIIIFNPLVRHVSCPHVIKHSNHITGMIFHVMPYGYGGNKSLYANMFGVYLWEIYGRDKRFICRLVCYLINNHRNHTHYT